MSHFDYQYAKRLVHDDAPFYALIMAAMWRADTDNVMRLKLAFPDVWEEVNARYRAPGGLLSNEH